MPILRTTHTTTYKYSETVAICHTEVRLAPRSTREQTLLEHELTIEPLPSSSDSYTDYFGNSVTTVTIDEPHQTLRIDAVSLVECHGLEAIHPALTSPWEQVGAAVRRYNTDETF